ncbi:hypothetical protein AK812_SmicGene42627 [Symbiodinium microadriaticum]|uniref:Uncharacterized protein n=1 Tax=Symbiodinium microadriaticum TaxID=2951 RepID=A0A1Q9C338_SYMMI|nr:hypothetical protein AK812_SmicGene42627 [Symbiodinium microadriaticum]
MMEELLPFNQRPALWIYEHADPQGQGAIECAALILAKRPTGLLVAIPQEVISEEELAVAREAQMDDVLGPSVVLEAPAIEDSGEGFLPLPDLAVSALILDFSSLAAPHFQPLVRDAAPELLVCFDGSQPGVVPDPAVLLQLALEWAQSMGGSERVMFYSADEGPAETPSKPKRPVLKLSKQDPPPQPSGAFAGGPAAAPKGAPQKRPTTAALATQLETLSDGGDGEQADSHGEATCYGACLSPRPAIRDQGEACRGLAEAEATEALEEYGGPAQQQDPSGAVPGPHEPGASQRAKMQDELSSGRGTFYTAVLQNMARRMSPAVAPSADPAELLQQGVCLSRYWERFGGFAGQRDLGAIAHSLAHALDCLQAGHVLQASDHLSLLAVCIEQMSMDAGRAELGFQLTWLEDPPAAMFTARGPRSSLHTRAFAPLASQRWVAIVLSYVKELDVIQTKRQDMRKAPPPGGGGSPQGDETEESPPSRPRRPPRKKQT